jgi:hypothetical protein
VKIGDGEFLLPAQARQRYVLTTVKKRKKRPPSQITPSTANPARSMLAASGLTRDVTASMVD